MVQPHVDCLSGHQVLGRITLAFLQQLVQLPCCGQHDFVNASSKSEQGCCLIQLGLQPERIKIFGGPQNPANELVCGGFGTCSGGCRHPVLALGCATPDGWRIFRQRLPPFKANQRAEPQQERPRAGVFGRPATQTALLS